MYLILLGPPGSGKGTQAERLKEQLGLPHVASGDLFRENIGSETELGLLAKGFIDRGQLVPDDVTIAMVRERLQQPDCDDGVILDGFPRTLAQAEALGEMLASTGRTLAGVLYINVPDEELVRRLSGRWICGQCQTPYHTVFSPPAEEGVCDECGGDLYQRDDDRPETVRARLKVYREQTAPLIDYYRRAGLLVEVDGAGHIETVNAALLDAIRSLASKERVSIMISSATKTQITKAIDEKVVAAHRYISDLWPELTWADDPDDEERIPLPYPYVAPSADKFPYLFYWDSYFTLVGLAVDGQRELMRWIVDNFLHEMREFGFVLNYSHPDSITRSQPPYLTSMIKEVLKHDLDHDWLREAFTLARAEYEEVWVGSHNTPVGLSHYCDQGAPNSEKRAQYESGWDFSSRWKGRCRHLAAVDLNCNLYQYERDLAEFARLLGDDEEANRWLAKSEERRERIMRYLYDPLQGLFFDYDYLTGQQLNDRYSLATFHPLFVGLVTSQEAAGVVEKLGLFEQAGGLVTTSRQHRAKDPYQWDYPNGWAPLHWVALNGLKRYGYFEEAARLAVKWLTLGAEMFAQTGKMWEKYNVVERNLAVVTPYPNQHGFGWTNGVYSALLGKLIGGLDFDLARQVVIIEPLLCPTFAGQEFAAHFRRYLVGDLTLRFSSEPDLRRVEIGVAAGQAIPAIEVRVRDYFPTEVPLVTLNGAPCDYRRGRQPYGTMVVEVKDVEDVTLSVAWDGARNQVFR